MIDDHLGNVNHMVAGIDRVGRIEQGIAVFGRGIHHRKIENIVGCIKLDEEVEDLVDNPAAAGSRLVDLVDDDDHRQVVLQGFLQHEIGLGHRPLLGVDEQQGAIGHPQHPFHLPAEIGMTGGVDDIDPIVLELVGTVLGGNGNPALPLQIHGIHQPLGYFLVVAKHPRIFKKLIYQSGFAMIDMSDNCHITNFILFHPAPFKATGTTALRDCYNKR